jgi:hypothetical protein
MNYNFFLPDTSDIKYKIKRNSVYTAIETIIFQLPLMGT